MEPGSDREVCSQVLFTVAPPPIDHRLGLGLGVVSCINVAGMPPGTECRLVWHKSRNKSILLDPPSVNGVLTIRSILEHGTEVKGLVTGSAIVDDLEDLRGEDWVGGALDFGRRNFGLRVGDGNFNGPLDVQVDKHEVHIAKSVTLHDGSLERWEGSKYT